MSAILVLDNISKTFNPGTVDEKKALTGLSLEIKRGDFITIIGANGAGKSTLFNAISGVFLVDQGKILLGGEDITYTPEHIRSKQIGRLFQDPMRGSAPGMSIEENLALAAGKGGWFSTLSKIEKERFRYRIAMLGMGLENRMKMPVGLLSGGQRQALTLMMATFNPPKILLLDEHTAALDPKAAEKILSLTRSIVETEKITCMMITHNMQSAIDLGNRLFMMNAGNIIFEASGREKSSLTVDALIRKFSEAAGAALSTDRMLLNE